MASQEELKIALERAMRQEKDAVHAIQDLREAHEREMSLAQDELTEATLRVMEARKALREGQP